MGVFNLGRIVGAFAKPKTKRIYNSDALQSQIDNTVGRMGAYRTAMDKSLSDYDEAMRANIEEQKRLNALSLGEINQDVASEQGADFMGDRERVRSGDLAALSEWMGSLGGTMSRADKLAASRLGYAGRPSSGYLDEARANRVAGYSAPIANSIFAGLTDAATAADRARGARLLRRAGLREERGALPDRISDRVLQPAQARSWAMGDETGILGNLSNVNRSNLAGFKEEKNQWAEALDAVDESLNSALDTYMSMYGMGAGGMGGGAGGMGGILSRFGGGQASAPSSAMGGLTPEQYALAMRFRQQSDPAWNPNLYE